MSIRLTKVDKIYGQGDAKVHALKELSLTITTGEMVAIMGPSGSGKSTLLNILGCIDRPTKGEYSYKENEISHIKAKEMARLRNEVFGFVIQDFALVDRYTVFKNIMIPLSYSQKAIKSKKEKVESVLKQLNISEKRDVLAANLSGGQRQRVAIARAIVNEPEIILADEPTGSLDSATGQDVLDIFTKLNSVEKKTIIIVTHDKEVASCCHRIVNIQDGMIV
ncbi:ABC transporter ATP-binding protein [Proteinivorax hydrogeniformans]|uniref:ABC transporter ATP-binding protein n=1 Tax=Proteinivorax hydrogeniformans TaxID=1826727 RepID=A0AAU8HS11_9FIRM